MRSRSTRGVLVLVFVGAVVVVAGYVSASGGAAHPPLVSGYDIPETLDGRFELTHLGQTRVDPPPAIPAGTLRRRRA